MSGQRPSEIIAGTIKEISNDYRSSSPFDKGVAQASLGVGGVTLCVYTAATLPAHNYPPAYQWGWLGVMGVSLVLLYAGVRGARGPVNPIQALMAVLTPAGLGWGVWYLGGPAAFQNYYVRGFTYAILVTAVVRLWLSVRGIGRSAEKIVRRQVEQNEINWKPVRRR